MRNWKALITIEDDGKPVPLTRKEVISMIHGMARQQSGVSVKIQDLAVRRPICAVAELVAFAKLVKEGKA